MKNKKLRVGVIGVGNMGRHHARVYSEIDNVELVGVADTNPRIGQAIARRYNCQYYKDHKTLLAKEDIDAATIAVPTSLHKKVAISCIDHGIAVLIEKPIAESIKSAQAIINRAQKRHVPVCIGHIERFNPAVQKLKDMIKRGKFGRIIAINTKRVGLYPPQITDTDVVIDLAVHDIDVCNFLLNKAPISVYARAGTALNSKRYDYSDIFLNYNGVDVIVQVNWITPVKVRELTLTGIKAYAELSYINQTLKIYKKGHGDDVDVVNTEEIGMRKEEPLKREIVNFTEYVRGEKTGIVTPAQGLLSLRVALAAKQSYQRKKCVELSRSTG